MTGRHDLSASHTDGSWIAFWRRKGGRGSLWILPARGDEPRALLSDEFDHAHPAWSADSRSIVFVSNRGGPADLWEIDVASRRRHQLTTGGLSHLVFPVFPVVARDGRIAYNKWSHQTDLYVA